jgi:hypothetical protein
MNWGESGAFGYELGGVNEFIGMDNNGIYQNMSHQFGATNMGGIPGQSNFDDSSSMYNKYSPSRAGAG